jgi:hypothetical protein
LAINLLFFLGLPFRFPTIDLHSGILARVGCCRYVYDLGHDFDGEIELLVLEDGLVELGGGDTYRGAGFGFCGGLDNGRDH